MLPHLAAGLRARVWCVAARVVGGTDGGASGGTDTSSCLVDVVCFAINRPGQRRLSTGISGKSTF
jgi:hypothetical protein